MTAVLRVQGGRESLADPQIRASLELYVSTEAELATIRLLLHAARE